MRLEGTIAIVTGADSGIGQATAEEFAKEGADAAFTYLRDAEGAEGTRRLVEAAGRRALAVQADQRDLGPWRACSSAFRPSSARPTCS